MDSGGMKSRIDEQMAWDEFPEDCYDTYEFCIRDQVLRAPDVTRVRVFYDDESWTEYKLA